MTELRVVATAGHVDHGKSSLIVRLTGMDPDRWEEEKRRGLTIDLGYAWCELPSGREVGFVDVPGHERFIANMLAGVGPVRLVLFVVAANEGWRRQSEEHLAILDVLGVEGGVVALTKRDLVDDEGLDLVGGGDPRTTRGHRAGGRERRPRLGDDRGGPRRASGGARRSARRASPLPRDASAVVRRPCVHDRRGGHGGHRHPERRARSPSATRWSSTPTGRTARIRSLQTHKRDEAARDPGRHGSPPTSSGPAERDLARGDVVGAAGRLEADDRLRRRAPARPRPGPPDHRAGRVQGLRRRGGGRRPPPDLRWRPPRGGTRKPYVRITTTRPLVLDVFDRFVLRESGRQETVGGGSVLDPAPPRRAGPSPQDATRPARRGGAGRAARDPRRGARSRPRAPEALVLTGSAPASPRPGEWLLRDGVLDGHRAALVDHVAAFHDAHPLEEGEPLASARRALADLLRPDVGSPDPRLVDADPRPSRRTTGCLVRTSHRGRAAVASTGDAPGARPRRPAGGRGDRLRARAAADDQGAGGAGDRSRRGGRRGAGPAWSSASPPISCSSRRCMERAEAIVAMRRRHRDHGERVPRGARDQPEVRRAAPGVVRPAGRDAARRRPAVPALVVDGSRRRRPYPETSAVTVISTLAPSGSDATPTAALAWRPSGPSTLDSTSLAPFATVGCSTNSGVAPRRTP